MLDISSLNEAQKNAMMDTDGAVLVLAGAGSGKTRVLTYRIAYLVTEKNVEPWNILAITFTNKATNEMRERLDKLLGERNKVWISTFHSLCANILKRYADRIGYSENFSIYDESDSNRALAKVLKQKGLDAGALKDHIRGYISEAKNEGLSPDEYYARIRGEIKEAQNIRDVFEGYEEILHDSNAMDFDDLLHKTKRLFVSCPDVLQSYQNRFHYIHVDEFQDTNGVQFDLVRMLAGKWGNLFVVGDDDQSIYGWRGAKVENILHFDKYFSDTKIHKLFQNYRSTPNILEVANNVIRNNTARHEKELFTTQKPGVKVEFYNAYNDREETQWIVETIRALKRSQGYGNKDFAILLRVNSLSRSFENAFAGLNMKYRVLGGFKFFERKEIQDVIAYMRVTVNPRDNEAVKRIINFPRRGIGDTSVERIEEYAGMHGQSMMDVVFAINRNDALPPSAAKKVHEFGVLMNDLIENRSLPLAAFSEYLVRQAGFGLAYTATGTEEDENRWENIQEFLRHIREFADANQEAGLAEFLQTVSLMPERKEEIYDHDLITIATMHAVKGLEFPVVFIAGCEEDIFPSAQSKREDRVEEERRLMYVAATRAKERLYISCARQRFRFNKVMSMLASRFMVEAQGGQQTRLDTLRAKWENESYQSRRENVDADYDDMPRFHPPAPARAAFAVPPVRPAVSLPKTDVTKFKLGSRVLHKNYGSGTIIMLSGSGADTQATIQFDGLGVKKFLLALAPLEIIQ
jgi:DNA helicase-2/ATP-dependent DNA helicase PcrA